MEPVRFLRPKRTILCCQAKIQLINLLHDWSDWGEPVDDNLLNDLATTLLQADPYQTHYQQCTSQQDMESLNNQLVAELVNTYRAIALRQQDETIQRLNALLNQALD